MNLDKKNILIQVFIVLICFNIMSVSVYDFNKGVITNTNVQAQVSDTTESWNATLTIQSSDGSGFTLKLGESTDAKDGVDPMDAPAPPSPPQLPHINARFLTSFSPPKSELIYEYRSFPNENNTWNFSVIWFAGPENSSITNISISWDNSAFENSEYSNIILLENNTFVKNMLTSEEYTYSATSNVPSFFAIVCSQGISNDTKDQNGDTTSDSPFLPISILIPLMLIISYMIFRKRNIKK